LFSVLLLGRGGSPDSGVAIRVGYLPATHDILLFIAKDASLFPNSLQVETVPYKNSPDMLRDLAAQRLDLAIPGVAAPLNFISSGHEFTIVGGAAAESAAVVVPLSEARRFEGQSTLQRIKNFKGLRVGTVRQSTGDALFRKALKDAGVLDSVDIREYGDPNALLSELRNQFIDGAVLWSPHMSRAEASVPQMKIVLWLGEVLPHHVCCRQVVRDSFLRTQRKSVVLYLAGIIRAMEFYQSPSHHEQVIGIARHWISGTPDDILEKELFSDKINKTPPRTTVSVDLDKDGIQNYVDAMKSISGLDSAKVMAKVDATLMQDAYEYLGLSQSDAAKCTAQGFIGCPSRGLK
jgi:NitT/TauT family transport system substrate-binding protein